MRNGFFLIFFFFGLSLLLIDCVSDHRVEQCDGKEFPSVDFTVGEYISNAPEGLIASDTVLSGRTIEFEAIGDFQEYEWQIGNLTNTTSSKKISVFFDKVTENQSVQVQLRVGKPIDNCLSNRLNHELVKIKNIVLVSPYESAAIGRFEGALEGDPQRFIVEIKYCQQTPSLNSFICTSNINRGCNNHYEPPREGPVLDVLVNFRSVKIGTTVNNSSINSYYNSASGCPGNNCNDPVGWVFFGKSVNDIIIEYTTGEYPTLPGSKRTSHRFIGKRI